MSSASILKVNHLPVDVPELWVLDHHRAKPWEGPADDEYRSRAGHLVYRTKYRRDSEAARMLKFAIQESTDCLPRRSMARRADLIASLPMSETNKGALEVIAQGLGKALNVRVLPGEIKWLDPNSPPIMKNTPLPDRPETIAGKLEANPIAGAVVLLVDDLVQTGSSLGESVRALKVAGASHVVCFAATLVGGYSAN